MSDSILSVSLISIIPDILTIILKYLFQQSSLIKHELVAISRPAKSFEGRSDPVIAIKIHTYVQNLRDFS